MDDRYFEYLIDLMRADDIYRLCGYLDGIEFTWSVALDANRMQDVMTMREVYADEFEEISDRNYGYCSVFEMLVAMAIKCDRDIMYDASEGPRGYYWFRIFLENLYGDLKMANELDGDEIVDICMRFIERRYDRHGNGGMFPMKHSKIDQRRVQLWIQMNAWILENFEI